MKMGKLRAVLVALAATCALSLGMAAPAMADEAGVEVNDNGITELCFTKNAEATGTSMPAATFSFTMTPATVEADTTINGMSVVEGVPLTNNKTTISTADMTDNNSTATTQKKTAEGKFTLPTSGLSANTVYRYEVKESDPGGFNTAGLVYTVDLYTDKNATVVAAVSYLTDNNTTSKKPIVFSNNKTTETTSLKITKTVAGNQSDSTQEFDFTLTLDAYGAYSASDTVSATYSKSGVETGPVTVTIGTAYAFKLTDGGSLVINDLPVGMEYTVVEATADGYKTTCDTTFADGSTTAGESSSVTHTLRSGDGINIEAFTNTRDTTTITGVAVEYGPYIAVLAIAVVGAVAFALKRRRNANEG